MSQLNVDTLRNRLGVLQPFIAGTATAWVNFNGTGTVAIRSSFNVSSITDNGTGDYTPNLTSALSNTDYAIVFGVRRPDTVSGEVIAAQLYNGESKTTSSFRFHTQNVTPVSGGSVDLPEINVAIFGG